MCIYVDGRLDTKFFWWEEKKTFILNTSNKRVRSSNSCMYMRLVFLFWYNPFIRRWCGWIEKKKCEGNCSFSCYFSSHSLLPTALCSLNEILFRKFGHSALHYANYLISPTFLASYCALLIEIFTTLFTSPTFIFRRNLFTLT